VEEFVLSTHVETLEKLKGLNLELFGSVFIGDPTCSLYPENIMVSEERILKAVDFVKSKDERIEVVLCTFAEPRNKDLSWQLTLLERVFDKVDFIEVHNMGVLRFLSKELGFSRLIMGFFGNIYTHKTLEVLKDFGIVRSFLNPELSIEEIMFIKENSPVDIIIFAHGKLPLGISESCFIKEVKIGECRDICEPLVIESAKWKLASFGFATFSAKDWNIFEYTGAFLLKGFKYFHIQGLRERIEYINKVAYIYKKVCSDLISGRDSQFEDLAKELLETTRYGFCNGYLFRRAGSRYVGRLFGGEEPQTVYADEVKGGFRDEKD
jgi:putative protease